MKFRTLASLLDAQPRGLTRNPDHRLLWDHFMASEKLQCLRISPRCYRLLDRARIAPENLKKFYRTYRLPEDPFFPLFLAVKSSWLEERERWKEDRESYILEKVRSLPAEQRKSLRMLAEFEESLHPSGRRPVWDKDLYPGTKKRTREILNLDEAGWQEFWRRHLEAICNRYPEAGRPDLNENGGKSARLLAGLMLHCSPDSRKEIVRSYRKLSKRYHPDHGGDPAAFLNVKAARDFLLKEF